MRRHLPIAAGSSRVSWSGKTSPFPPLALSPRGLVNALCHRDYSICGGAVGVAIRYDDRLEINSTGLLPFGLPWPI